MYEITSATPTLASSTQAFSVTEINTIIADLLASGLPSFIWVEGEVSNLSVAASGHRYLSLKDSGATISCALFRGSANRIHRDILNNLKNGDKVVVKANLSVYKPRGGYQLIISDIEPSGFGALARAFAELKAKLDAAGLTATERKLPIPSWPRGIGVVTSETGAAIRDVLTTLERRAPFIPVTVYPTLVQGDGAPDAIVSALERANSNPSLDVILLVRGGGSLEDLVAFNDERVAMAVVDARLPVISGVGHETDFTIVDCVSDYRAATPTGAAEIASPDREELLSTLNRLSERLNYATRSQLHTRQRAVLALHKRLQVQYPLRQLQLQQQRLDELTERLQRGGRLWLQNHKSKLFYCRQQLLSASPQRRLERSQEQIVGLKQRLVLVAQQRLTTEISRLDEAHKSLAKVVHRHERCKQQLKGLEARLALLSPLGVLQRGYSLTFDERDALLGSVEDIHKGDVITIRLADGVVKAIVADKTPFK